MKRKIFGMVMMAALGLCMAVCGSDGGDEPDSVTEKTYADDDFLMTERNIKEKLIGTWEIAELRTYEKGTGWTTQTAADMGELGTVKFNADGSGELLGLDGVRWRVGKDTLVVSSLYLTARVEGQDASAKFSLPLYVYAKDGYTREMIEAELRRMYPTAVIGTELQEYKRLKVNRMSKDFFDLRETGKSMGDFWELKRLW